MRRFFFAAVAMAMLAGCGSTQVSQDEITAVVDAVIDLLDTPEEADVAEAKEKLQAIKVKMAPSP